MLGRPGREVAHAVPCSFGSYAGANGSIDTIRLGRYVGVSNSIDTFALAGGYVGANDSIDTSCNLPSSQ